MRWVARFTLGVLVRVLLAMGGAVAGYGATGMLTSRGLMPLNAIAGAGLLICTFAAVVLWLQDHRLSGIWPALVVPGIPYSLYALGSFGVSECAPPYQPITASYSCAPVGTHAVAVIAPLVVVLAIALAAIDVRSIARSRRAPGQSGSDPSPDA